jgi:endonuclease/exonuclease/phosphatase family metal-dependent hydrolase
LRVLHWNIHSWRDAAGNPNVEAVADLVRQTAPDAVSFVEVDEPWGTPRTLRKLAADCGYSWLFTPTFQFGSDEPAGGFGNALLTRLPIQAVQQWPLLWPSRVYDGSEPSEPRSVTLAAVTAGSAPVWIGTTHLPRSDGHARDDALKRLMALARGLGDHWVICGDFNTPASEWVTGYPPVTVGPPGPQPTYPAVRPTEAIDYCIAASAIQVDVTVLSSEASDHLPQLISVRLPT